MAATAAAEFEIGEFDEWVERIRGSRIRIV